MSILGKSLLGASIIALILAGGYVYFRHIIKCIKCLDLDFVKKWIGNLDFEEYNSEYICVLLKNKDIPMSVLIKDGIPFRIKNLAYLTIYDKRNKKLVHHELLRYQELDEQFVDDTIEIQFD